MGGGGGRSLDTLGLELSGIGGAGTLDVLALELSGLHRRGAGFWTPWDLSCRVEVEGGRGEGERGAGVRSINYRRQANPFYIRNLIVFVHFSGGFLRTPSNFLPLFVLSLCI